MLYKILLIIAGWAFCIVVSPKSIVFLLAVTLFGYALGLYIDNNKKPLLTVGIIILVGALVWFKYGYIVTGKSLIIPLGLSYYTLMVIGYLIDVYRGDIKPEKDILSFALFVGFFPQIMAGPIGRSRKLLSQYNKKIKTSPEGMLCGFMMIIIGVMQKFIIADNLKVIVDNLMGDSAEAISVILSMLIYSLVIYFDFSGYSLIATGTGRVFGIRLMDNFKSPYFSESIKEFWRRWHISLSTWFRDYVYIPLGGNKKGAVKRDINTLIVFILSGAWHGGAIGFWIWGLLHGIYLVIENHIKKRADAKKSPKIIKILKKIIIFILVSVAWIPFYAGSFSNLIKMISDLFKPDIGLLKANISDGVGVSLASFTVVIFCLIISFIISIYQERHNYSFYEALSGHGVCVLLCALAVFVLTLFTGVYGSGYDASIFIYGGF